MIDTAIEFSGVTNQYGSSDRMHDGIRLAAKRRGLLNSPST